MKAFPLLSLLQVDDCVLCGHDEPVNNFRKQSDRQSHDCVDGRDVAQLLALLVLRARGNHWAFAFQKGCHSLEGKLA